MKTAEEIKPNVIDFLKSKDPNFSMFTASNRSFPLIEWMSFIEEFASQQLAERDSTIQSLKKEVEGLRKAWDYSEKCAYKAGVENAKLIGDKIQLQSTITTQAEENKKLKEGIEFILPSCNATISCALKMLLTPKQEESKEGECKKTCNQMTCAISGICQKFVSKEV